MPNSKKRCTFCKCYFPADKMISVPVGKFCSKNHLFKYATKRTAELIKKAKKLENKKHTQRKRIYLASNRPKRLRAASKAFNLYIRIRDELKPCISCDRPFSEIGKNDAWKPGGAWDAGHYLSVGAFPELRYEETNVHKQCKSCNGGAGKYTKKNHSVTKEYRIKLIERIGLEKVLWLESHHGPKKYKVDELIEIERIYNKKAKLLLEFAMRMTNLCQNLNMNTK